MARFTRRQFISLMSASGYLAAGIGARAATRQPPVVVVGGGYAGATAARYLRVLAPDQEIILVTRDDNYLSCPGSNAVLAGLRNFSDLRRDYQRLTGRFGVRRIKAAATGIDSTGNQLRLADGSKIAYSRLIVAPGIDFRWDAWEGYDDAASRLAPHAWQAGAQTLELASRLRRLRVGGTVMLVVPANPYRCPPGPYERASLFAHFLKQHNPRAKVIILDAKTQFSKHKLFQAGWAELYPNQIEWISSEKEGHIDRIDVRAGIVRTEFGEHRADLLNVIPPQKAGAFATACGLVDASGWCPVDPRSFESTLVPRVHVIGDACHAPPMPKSAFSANSQAKCAAAAVVALLRGDPVTEPALINHCYSFLSPDLAISVTGVYGYSTAEKQLIATATGETAPDGDRRLEARHAASWERIFKVDTFG